MSEAVIDAQLPECRQRHIQQNWKHYITLSERQRFTSGYEPQDGPQGRRDDKYNKKEMEIVTAYYLKQYVQEETKAFEQVDAERTRYRKKELYASWFAKRGVGKRAPRQSALDNAIKEMKTNSPVKKEHPWDNIIPRFFKKK